jgi:hypothetical protein
MSKRVSYGAMGLAILGLALLLGTAGSTSAMAPAVAVANISDVLVTNSTANPVNVRDLSRNELFSYPITFGIGSGYKSGIQYLNIPAGKRFVIRSVSIQAFAPAGQKFLGRLVTLSSGNSVWHNVAMSDQGAGLGGYSGEIHTGDREVLAYADPGSVQVVLYRNDGVGSVTVSGVLTGYLVDKP